jgi:hypothetical protein
MSNTVIVISFPGHFLLTRLTIESLRKYYPEMKNIIVVYDDNYMDKWPDYVNDCAEYYSIDCLHFIPFSKIDSEIYHCPNGWYRQQLVKCCLDRIVTEDKFFIVDGDIIFDEHIDVENIIPVHHYKLSSFTDNMALTIAVTNCTKKLLQVNVNPFLTDRRYSITSSIPFRVVEKITLCKLRQIVENNFQKNFVSAINELVSTNKLTTYPTKPNDLVMNEWELIETVNLMLNPKTPIVHTGSGYDYFFNTTDIPYGRFRQGYVYDYQLIDKNFFTNIPDKIRIKIQNLKQFLA